MCLTSDAVYRIRDADAIFRIERKDDQKIAQNTKLFYRNYFEFTTNTSGRVCGTLWRIVSKYNLFFCAWFSRFTEGTCRTRRITLREPRKITTDHDMRPIRCHSHTGSYDFLIVRLVAIWRTCDRSAMFATISGRILRSVVFAGGRSSYD